MLTFSVPILGPPRGAVPPAGPVGDDIPDTEQLKMHRRFREHLVEPNLQSRFPVVASCFPWPFSKMGMFPAVNTMSTYNA